jgi:hypothetical protein
MTPSPEQIAQWRAAAEKPYHDEYGIDNDARTKFAYTLGYLRARTEQATEIAALKDDLQFVERWAVHHGTKPHMTPENALSVIQHYPAIAAITKSYVDGKVPDTFNPYAEIAALKAQLQGLLDQPEVEPVAHMYPWDLERFATNETTAHAYSVAVGCPDGVSVPLYTHPAPFTPITADDVTDEMLDTYIADIDQHKLMDVKIDVAAAYNAVGKYMGANYGSQALRLAKTS